MGPPQRGRDLDLGLATEESYRSAAPLVAGLIAEDDTRRYVKDVSRETICDAGEPQKIDWYGDSYFDVPARR